jgi:hypothetical protein
MVTTGDSLTRISLVDLIDAAAWSLGGSQDGRAATTDKLRDLWTAQTSKVPKLATLDAQPASRQPTSQCDQPDWLQLVRDNLTRSPNATHMAAACGRRHCDESLIMVHLERPRDYY